MCAFDLILPLINKAIALLIYIDFSVENQLPTKYISILKLHICFSLFSTIWY